MMYLKSAKSATTITVTRTLSSLVVHFGQRSSTCLTLLILQIYPEDNPLVDCLPSPVYATITGGLYLISFYFLQISKPIIMVVTAMLVKGVHVDGFS